jgi:hypothetical protein
MARGPLETVTAYLGPFRATATISGYTSAYSDPISRTTTALTGIRSVVQTYGGAVRVRADIDWFLRPGQAVTTGDLDFTVTYINYYLTGRGDAYMDVGTRGNEPSTWSISDAVTTGAITAVGSITVS